MTVNQTLGALGSWEIQLRDETPDYILDQLGFFGHVAIADGPVDVDAVGAGLLTGARYVGVLRAKDKDTGRTLSGSGMVFWLGDEDGKGDILETEINLVSQTLAQCVTAIIGPSLPLDVGTVFPKAGTYTGKHQFQTRREALGIICDAFNVEFRVNGNGTVDVGTAADLYNTEAPDTIVVRRGAGTDMNLVALGGDYEVDESVYDYSTRVVLLGQTIGTGDTPDTVFATGSANAPSVPYVDLFGNQVKMTRTISESGQTTGSVAARAQLQLNRFNRVARSLKVDADEYETEGNFVVGDNVYVYDPDTGIVNAANEVTFRGEVLHPDVVRVSGVTWPVVQGMTVAFRTQAGVWLDLTPFVTWETGGNELTIGDLPKSLTRPGDNPVQARLDAARNSASDSTVPAAPTGLTLTTFSSLDARGRTVSTLNAEWAPVELNVDSSVITDLDHYILQYHWTARGTVWQQMFVAADVTETDVIVTPSLPYEARVAAVDIAGHVSAWSTVATITTAADAVAPPAPADPVVTSYLGQLRIEYAGTDAVGQPMPTDTNRIDVHVGTTSGFTASIATRVDSITPFAKGVSYATAPYSSTDNRWVRLIAVDHEGNSSAASAAVGGHTVQAGDGDIAALSVGKLTAGTMSADVIMAGRFTTALTGARREINAVGFQAYDASSNLTINLDGVNNLLTGRFRTAVTGRRMELGSSGVIGRIQFFAPDGTMSEIGSFTGATGGAEALRLSIPITGTSQLWNSIQMESGQSLFAWHQFIKLTAGGDGTGTKAFHLAFASGRGTSTDATIPETLRLAITEANSQFWHPSSGQTEFSDRASNGSTAVRFSINPLDINSFIKAGGVYRVWDYNPAAAARFTINAGATGEVQFQWPGTNSRTILKSGGVGDASAGIFVFNNANVGGRFVYAYNFGVEAFEVTDWANSYYIRLRASAFDVVSDRATKTDIADYVGDSLAAIRTARRRTWLPKGEVRPSGDGGKPGEVIPTTKRERHGFVADETPEHWRVPGGNGVEAIDVMAVIADLAGAVQKLDAELDDLRKAKK